MRRIVLSIIFFWFVGNVFADLNDVQLDEVTVSEGKENRLKSKVSQFATETITADGLVRAACCNLSESFETDPSVDVSYSDAATGAKTIHLLGLSGTYVQINNENTPNVRGLGQTFGLEFIPGPWMQSIQISKGASTVRNGYEAISGQINVECLKPQVQDPFALNFMINSELHTELNLMGGWNFKKLDPSKGRLYTGVMAHYQNGLLPMDHNGDTFLDMPLNQNLNLANRWFFMKENYILQLFVKGVYDNRRGGQIGEEIKNPYVIQLRNRRVEGFMKNAIILNRESDMSLGIITSASYHSTENQYGNSSWLADQVNGYLNAIFENNWSNSHKLGCGISFNFDKYNESILQEPYFGVSNAVDLSRSEIVPGVFAEYTYKYEDKFSMVVGLRGDWSSRFGLFATPRLNLKYSPVEWLTVRGSAGMGYRAAYIIADNSGFLPSARCYDVSLIKNRGFEKAVNTGASLLFDIPIGSKTLSLSMDYYCTQFLDAVVADADANPNKVLFYMLSDVADSKYYSHCAQIEASIEVVRGLSLLAAFRYNDVKQTSFNSVLNIYTLRDKVFENRFKGLVTVSYKTPLKKWQFDVTAQFNGDGRLPDAASVFVYNEECKDQYLYNEDGVYHKWYPQLMAQITKYFRHWSIYIGSSNMTDYKQKSPIIGSATPFSSGFDASNSWAPISGWQIYAGVRWNLERKDE